MKFFVGTAGWMVPKQHLALFSAFCMIRRFVIQTGLELCSKVSWEFYCFEALDRPDRLEIALFGNRGTA
jgi:hypothetical protein